MNIQKKIAMTFGGAVLAACLAVGGLAAANAATPASTSAATTAATTTTTTTTAPASAKPTAAATTTTTVAVPPAPNGPFDWNDYIKTLTPAQQEALLGEQEASLAHYKEIGFAAAVEKLTYNVDALEKALGQ